MTNQFGSKGTPTWEKEIKIYENILKVKNSYKASRSREHVYQLSQKCGNSARGKTLQPSFYAINIIECRSHFSLINITCLTSYVLKWPRGKKAGAVNFQEGKISGGIPTISGNPRIASNNRQADESTYKTQECIRS